VDSSNPGFYEKLIEMGISEEKARYLTDKKGLTHIIKEPLTFMIEGGENGLLYSTAWIKQTPLEKMQEVFAWKFKEAQ